MDTPPHVYLTITKTAARHTRVWLWTCARHIVSFLRHCRTLHKWLCRLHARPWQPRAPVPGITVRTSRAQHSDGCAFVLHVHLPERTALRVLSRASLTSLMTCPFKYFAHFKIALFPCCFESLNFNIAYRPFIRYLNCEYFLLVSDFIFRSFNGVFKREVILIWWSWVLLVFYLRRCLPHLPASSLAFFYNFCTFQTMIHSELTFVYGVKYEVHLFAFTQRCPIVPAPLVKKTFFPPELPLHLGQKSVWLTRNKWNLKL